MSARHRRGNAYPNPSSSDESDDDDDVFSTLKQKKSRMNKTTNDEMKMTSSIKTNLPNTTTTTATTTTTTNVNDSFETSNVMETTKNVPVKASVTSSMKRHHGAISSSRKAKMDALLQELKTETIHNVVPKSSFTSKKIQRTNGSFVQPGEEDITTNLFVGNLPTHITEDQVYEVFGQFGPLHSVKIMWPRTAEERYRNRHTGFVCFRYRPDAEVALNELDDTDAFRTGKFITVRWGRNIPSHREEIMSFRSNHHDEDIPMENIRVTIPPNPEREHFITTLASEVAKDASSLEAKLQKELESPCNESERVYYRWRVWSFVHGDSWKTWRTEPFVMQEGGPKWIPPPLSYNTDVRDKTDAKLRDRPNSRPNHDRVRSDGRELTKREKEEFDMLFRKELNTSRDAVCKAMAFCFDKSASFQQICIMLQDLIQKEPARDIPKDVAIEQKTAQLFLLSDILFNSQQPGVRNAFRYRDAIEKMAPEVFTAVGKMDWGGRLTRNKLAVEVSAILGAWTNWSVYSPSFLDELHDRFEGRTIKPKDEVQHITQDDVDSNANNMERDHQDGELQVQQLAHEGTERIDSTPKGDWANVELLSKEQQELENASNNMEDGSLLNHTNMDKDRGPSDTEKRHDMNLDADDVDGEPLEEDMDGEPLDDDVDGEPLEGDIDGEPLDDGIDGEPLEEDIDGEPLDDDIDGEPLDDE